MDTRLIDSETFKMLKSIGLPGRDQSNPYVVLSVRGDGVRAPESWTATVYRNKKGQLKLVTSDDSVLRKLLPVEQKPVIQVDDSGWGFPLGGVMIGATDGTRVETGLIDTKFFQGELFKTHAYLSEAARITLGLVKDLGGRPGETRVEICSGYVNSRSKDLLEREGYDVKVTEITGLLQDQLEKRYKEYVKSLGYPAYYDPKETRSPAMAFKEVIKWIDEDPENRMKIAKTGWKYFRSKRT
ncbi:hypothetical protein [Methanocella arvoryzae]|uniref:Uncharacterized protein n=1 Tax=Methanocella arvoryzae (strain DSM 22066 / NBRC 105507 / MRE50) TaxID=351160 RepID=Q0W699_METAR|nr:hypothetical protein [Methanocella arvoryzae]CAH04834.1 hypothetical protein orf2 [uncultured archaeon]CAJ36094.1 hypothetical protein RCIX704 [Methanocella arvoryzae MRE50]